MTYFVDVLFSNFLKVKDKLMKTKTIVENPGIDPGTSHMLRALYHLSSFPDVNGHRKTTCQLTHVVVKFAKIMFMIRYPNIVKLYDFTYHRCIVI